jgi:ribosomal protein S27AE
VIEDAAWHGFDGAEVLHRQLLDKVFSRQPKLGGVALYLVFGGGCGMSTTSKVCSNCGMNNYAWVEKCGRCGRVFPVSVAETEKSDASVLEYSIEEITELAEAAHMISRRKGQVMLVTLNKSIRDFVGRSPCSVKRQSKSAGPCNAFAERGLRSNRSSTVRAEDQSTVQNVASKRT